MEITVLGDQSNKTLNLLCIFVGIIYNMQLLFLLSLSYSASAGEICVHIVTVYALHLVVVTRDSSLLLQNY